MTALACRCGHAVTYHEPTCYAMVVGGRMCVCVRYLAHFPVEDGWCRCGAVWTGEGRCLDA